MEPDRSSAASAVHRAALVRTMHRRAVVHGSITVPAVPELLDDYLEMCLDTFTAVGVRFDEDQTDHLRDVLRGQLHEAFTASPRSEIVITYDSPVGHMINYRVAARWSTIAQTYDKWATTREAPYFGAEPDARVWGIACAWSDPTECKVLDIGAGTGRNALALARRGHPVDAVEVSAEFADRLDEAVRRESLPVTVLRTDILGDSPDLRSDYQLVVISEVASDLRSVEELRRMIEVAAKSLAPGGRLVMNAFLPQGSYEPDAAALQLGQQTYTAIFTTNEIGDAAAAFDLELLDNTSVLAYETEHQREDAWPPTPWYENWIRGRDLFSEEVRASPIELRWLVFRKAS